MGSAASSIASSEKTNLTLDDCKEIVGEEYYQEVYDKYKRHDGTVAKDKLIELSEIETDVFLSHDWGHGFQNHNRVAKFNEYLLNKGVKTWFDSDKMRGDIVKKMCNGIDKTKCVIVFVTDNYVKKVDSSNFNDNCQLEFKYSMRQKSGSLMIPVCMESSQANALKWKGPVGMVLGGTIYVSATEDNDFETSCEELYTAICKCIIDNYPSFLQIGMIIKQNKSKYSNENDGIIQTENKIIVTKYDADDVFKNIRTAVANLSKKNIPDNWVECLEKAFNDLLEALNEGPHRQYDFAENGTCEIITKYLQLGQDDGTYKLSKLACQCVIKLCSYQESEGLPFINNSENIQSFVSAGICKALRSLISEDCEADFLRIAFYCIAALVEDIDVCKSFDEVDISEVLYKITEYNQNESDIPILRNLFCAISRLCAYDEYYLIKQHLGKTGIIKNIVALLKEFSSQDEILATYACSALGCLCDNVCWYKYYSENEDDEKEEELNNTVSYSKFKYQQIVTKYPDGSCTVTQPEIPDGEENILVIDENVSCLVIELFESEAHKVVIDVLREFGMNDPKISAVAINALARMSGRLRLRESNNSISYFYLADDNYETLLLKSIQESKVLVQIVKMLKKYGENYENVTIYAFQIIAVLIDSETTIAALQKIDGIDIIYNILKKLGLNAMNSAKDETIVIHAIDLLRTIMTYTKYNPNDSLCKVLITILNQFIDNSSIITANILILISNLLENAPNENFEQHYTIARKFKEMRIIELYMKAYFKYRFYIYISPLRILDFMYGKFFEISHDYMNDAENRQAYMLEIEELLQSNDIQAMYEDMSTSNYQDKLIEVGTDEYEIDEFKKFCVEKKLVLEG